VSGQRLQQLGLAQRLLALAQLTASKAKAQSGSHQQRSRHDRL